MDLECSFCFIQYIKEFYLFVCQPSYPLLSYLYFTFIPKNDTYIEADIWEQSQSKYIGLVLLCNLIPLVSIFLRWALWGSHKYGSVVSWLTHRLGFLLWSFLFANQSSMLFHISSDLQCNYLSLTGLLIDNEHPCF